MHTRKENPEEESIKHVRHVLYDVDIQMALSVRADDMNYSG
jgi:hypothetical protein